MTDLVLKGRTTQDDSGRLAWFQSGGPGRGAPGPLGDSGFTARVREVFRVRKKSQAKKKPQPAAVRGVTRQQLVERLEVSESTVDRLIRSGLPSIGTRGRAHTYSLREARTLLARRQHQPDAEAARTLVSDYQSHAEDLHDRRQQLLAEHVADEAWQPAWAALCAHVARQTSRWPGALAARLGGATAAEARRLAVGEGPRVDPPRPWPDAPTWAPPTYPDRVLRPRLERLAASLEASLEPLLRAVVPPEAEAVPAIPADVDASRQAWRAARAAYRRARVAVRRGHRRRDDLQAAIGAALREHTATWWASRSQWGALAGDRDRARAAVEAVRAEALRRLRGAVESERAQRRTT